MGRMILAMRFMSFPWWMPVMADAASDATNHFTAEDLGKWMAILFFVTAGGLSIRKMLQKPADPQRTQETSPPATKEEVDELKSDIMRRLERIDDELEGMRAVARDSQGKVHARIDKVSESLAEVKGELSQVNSNLRLLLERSIKPGTSR